MKPILLAMTLLAAVSLVACTTPPSAPVQAAASPTNTSSPVTLTMPIQTAANSAAEEAEIRDLVESFGKRLQNVSLLASDAAQELQKQYSGFVSPTLLEVWANHVSKAPGRMVSSPWPDRIEIIALSKRDSDRYEITGFVVEMTSTEVTSGGAAARIPVHIAVQRLQERWKITEFAEEQE